MMKQLKLSIVLTLLMSMVGLQVYADFDTSTKIEVGGLYYYLDNVSKKASVTFMVGNSYTGNITIPSSFTYNNQNYSVTSIGSSAFYDNSWLTSVTIPNSVTSIGSAAFRDCPRLTSITIPNSVTSIGDVVFSGCPGLTSMIVESGNTKYDSRNYCNAIIETASNTLLYGCKNTTIPNNVTSIGISAFNGCSSLTSVTIPNSVTSIGNYAFISCSGLTSMIVESGNTKYDSRNNCNAIIETASNTLLFGCKNTTIPNSVTSIEQYAFCNCTGLISIAIPNSVTSIGQYAFYKCHNLASIDIPNSVNKINKYTFYWCWNLKSVTIPNSVTTIGEEAFDNCVGLSSITIPASVTSIEQSAFRDCIPLASVISESETPPTISGGAFYNCPNAILMVPKNSISDYQEASYWNSFFTEIKAIQQTIDLSEIPTKTYGEAQYTLPQQTNEGLSLTWTIADNTIGSISGNTLTINNAGTTTVTATQAGNDIYDSFTKDYTLTVNKARLDVTANDYTIQQGATLPSYEVTYNGFKNSDTENDLTTKPVTSCSVSSSNTVGTYDIVVGGGVAQNYEFYYTNGTLTIGSPIINFADQYAKSACVAVWDTDHDGELSMQEAAAVESLSDATFDKNMTSFDELVYFTGLTSIISFQSYTKLTSIVIPSNVTSIPYRAFWGCTNLTSVTVPNSVTSIGQYAFSNCRNLLSITIPNGVTSIGVSAFYKCSSLTSITIPNGINVINQSTFEGCSGLTSIVIPNGVTSIGYAAFRDCTSLATVTIPNSVTTIGNYAFASTGLTSIVIPISVTSIGNDGFSWCEKIASISVESGNGKYDSRDNCNAIINTSTNKLLYGSNNTTIPNSVTSIGGSAFSYRKGLTSITIPNSVTSIEQYAFNNCSSLTSVTIPNSVTSIEQSTFSGCSSLISVSIPNSVTNIGLSAFSSCTSLTSITIPNSVTSIESYAFSSCTSLTSITIPNSVTSIESYAFSSCTGLTSITIPNSVTSIGSDAFSGCSGLTSMTVRIEEPLSSSICSGYESAISLYVPAGSVNAYKAANYWKNFKEILAIVKNEQTLELTAIPTLTYGDGTYTLPETTEEGRALTWAVANTNVATVSANVLTIHGAGFTTVTATNVGDDNYEDFSREFGLVVNKASLAISATNKSMTYGDDVPSLEIEYSGFKNGETATVLTTQPTITCSATNTSNAGVYVIQVSGATAANYDITLIPSTLTINKAPLTITAKSYTINQKDDLPVFEVTYDGFKNAETSSVLTTLPTITCDATDSETAGDFDITPSGAAATNYSFNYVSGTLTVNAVESVSITLNSLGKGTYCSKYPLDFTNVSGIYAYIICGFKPSAGNLSTLRVFEVPEETGLYIVGTPGNTYNIPVAPTDFYYTDMMKCVLVAKNIPATEDGYSNFVLASKNGGVFFKRANNTQSPANRAYVQVPTSTVGAREFLGIEIDDDSITGLDSVITSDIKEGEGDYYNLSGQKVQTPQRGIYIKNGKKIFIH